MLAGVGKKSKTLSVNATLGQIDIFITAIWCHVSRSVWGYVIIIFSMTPAMLCPSVT